MCINMTRFKPKIPLIILLAGLYGYGHDLMADTLESLVMPGPVIEGHKKYEQTCKKCHSVLSKAKQDMLCRDCHKKVSSDIRKKQGYHGRLAGNTRCKNCHTEHKGRKADIVKFNKQLFDHDKSDFRLTGKHKQVQCRVCHKEGKKYRDAHVKCIDCHKESSPHDMNKLTYRNKPISCPACHNPDGWNNMIFRHDKTDFKLIGRHESVKCVNCHPKDQYNRTPDNCYACHKFDDVHKRNKGKKCQKCHNPQGWRDLKFNHDKETEFPLKGRHGKLQCHDCHKQDPYKVKIKKACYSCHKADDRHHGRFGVKCDACHQPQGWGKVKFRHDVDTEFSLRGRHEKLRCEDCHTRNAYDHKTSTKCLDCHKKDDVHKGQQGEKCDRCHNETSWRKKVVFDHDLTKFPLLGLHSALACEECHIRNTYKDVDRKCYSCHEKDDEHEGRLGQQCQMCHNPNGWRIWDFDHNKQTRFKLEGKHSKLHCHACHKQKVSVVKNQLGACNDCHAADDVHDGQFGRDCARCHTTKTFKNAKINGQGR